jgi:hypothetical protein
MVAQKIYALVCNKKTDKEGKISSFNGIKPAYKLQSEAYPGIIFEFQYLNFSNKSA